MSGVLAPAAPSPALHAQFGEQLSRLHAMVEALSRQGGSTTCCPISRASWCRFTPSCLRLRCPRCWRGGWCDMSPRSSSPTSSGRRVYPRPWARRSAQCVPAAPPIPSVVGTRRIVALVGPTGVGKTTTVAKLAANFKLAHGFRLGLITVDTYRIAAVEQLRTYAEIIDLPLAVVNAPSEMLRASTSSADVDLVLIDTAGRSPRDEVKIRELADFLAPGSTRRGPPGLERSRWPRSLQAAVERFALVQVDRLILTKLDEADGLGGVFAVLALSSRPVSYLTTGQAVPDDIEPADRHAIGPAHPGTRRSWHERRGFHGNPVMENRFYGDRCRSLAKEDS